MSTHLVFRLLYPKGVDISVNVLGETVKKAENRSQADEI